MVRGVAFNLAELHVQSSAGTTLRSATTMPSAIPAAVSATWESISPGDCL